MKVRIFDNIDRELLKAHDMIECQDQPEVILVRSSDLHDINLIPRTVTGIFRAGVGTNNIPVEVMTKRGTPVFNTPGSNANAVKELVLGMMIMASRNCLRAIRLVDVCPADTDYEGLKKNFVGHEIAGKNILIIGLGNIGYQLAEACHNLGMKVYGYDPYIKVGAGWLTNIANLSSEVIKTCDFVTIHVPVTPGTKVMFDAGFISRLKGGVILFNFSRQELINPGDILNGLESGQINYFASDFVYEELRIYRGRVAMLPHLGASTEEAESNSVSMAIKQASNYWHYGDVKNSVNFPTVHTQNDIQYRRLIIVNRNVPGVLEKITREISGAGFNISGLENKTRETISYFAIDIDKPEGVDHIGHLAEMYTNVRALEDVLKVRIIEPSN